MHPRYVVALVIAVALVAYVLASKGKGGRQGSTQADALYRNLLTKCFGDKEQVERLIALERERAPNATDIEVLKNAIARWERHNR